MNQANQPWLPRAALAATGFVPIGCLCFALFGWIPLPLSLHLVIVPALIAAVAIGVRYPALGRLALRGLLAGMLATAIYDTLRLTFVLAGAWNDFIPAIGRMALDDPAASPLWGYVWRYLGDGGAMAVTFALLPWRGVRFGLGFGVAICFCLFGTLLLAPSAQQALFHLSPLTGTAALVGHMIYGGVLGWLLQAWAQGQPAARQRALAAYSPVADLRRAR